jgi:hypothetical protein
MAFIPFGLSFEDVAEKGKPEGMIEKLVIFVHHKHK